MHFTCRLIRQILSKIMKIYSDFGARPFFRSSYTCRYAVFVCILMLNEMESCDIESTSFDSPDRKVNTHIKNTVAVVGVRP